MLIDVTKPELVGLSGFRDCWFGKSNNPTIQLGNPTSRKKSWFFRNPTNPTTRQSNLESNKSNIPKKKLVFSYGFYSCTQNFELGMRNGNAKIILKACLYIRIFRVVIKLHQQTLATIFYEKRLNDHLVLFVRKTPK